MDMPEEPATHAEDGENATVQQLVGAHSLEGQPSMGTDKVGLGSMHDVDVGGLGVIDSVTDDCHDHLLSQEVCF